MVVDWWLVGAFGLNDAGTAACSHAVGARREKKEVGRKSLPVAFCATFLGAGDGKTKARRRFF